MNTEGKKSTPPDSATVMINALALKKMAMGIKIFNLGAGEPKLPMHDLLLQAAIDAMKQGKTMYPPVAGIPELRAAAAMWMKENYHCHYQAEQCVVTNGGKLGIYLLTQLLLNAGDEVIIPSPYWVSYPAITQLFGGIPHIIETEQANHWKLTPKQLQNACHAKSKILMLNNASNPTGALYSREELNNILRVAKENNLIVISDEVYSELVYDDHQFYSCGEFQEYADHVLVIQSCSKNFSMTGWRIGFVFGRQDIIKQVTSLVSQSTSGAATVGQWVALAALQHEKIIRDSVRLVMEKRRNIMIDAFARELGIHISPPPSSLYLFIALDTLGVKNISSAEFCQQVLEKANVALIPGSAFGKEGYVRLSYGGDDADLVDGVKALARFLALMF